MAENAPIGNNENELLMRCNIYFELLATEPDGENKITKENAAAKLIASIEGGDIYTIIKNKLRDCLIKLGEIYNIRENIQIKSLKQLMETNRDAINKLELEEGTVPKIEECPADTSIDDCKVKLNGYVEQLQKMGEKIKHDKAAKEQEEGNMEQHKEQVESINKILADLNLENKEKIEEVIKNLNQLSLEGDDQQNVTNIINDLNKIKNGSSDAEQVQQLESSLKEQESRTGELAKQEAGLESQAIKAQQEAKQYEANMVKEIKQQAPTGREESLSDAADNQEVLDAVDSVNSKKEGTEESKAGETDEIGSEEGSKESTVSPTASKPDFNQLKNDWENYLQEHTDVKDEPKTYMTWLRTVGSATDPNSTDKIRSKDNLIKLTKKQFPNSEPEEIHKELFDNVPSGNVANMASTLKEAEEQGGKSDAEIQAMNKAKLQGNEETTVSPTASKPDFNQLKNDWENYLQEHTDVKDEPKTYMTWLRTVGSATDPNSTDKIRSKDNLIKLTKKQFPNSEPEEIHKELFPPAPSTKVAKGQISPIERLDQSLGKERDEQTNRKADIMATSPISNIGTNKTTEVNQFGGGRNKKSRKNRKSSKKKMKNKKKM